jgi:two-component system, OmpR family, KDP operon response regulator KdpE
MQMSDGSPRVLIVDDDPEMRRALSLNLTARGYQVAAAADGSAALTQAAASRPDVMVLDLGLPDMDGMDVIRAVRGYSRIPIVVLSGRTSSGEKVDALEAGADDYVTKPFNVNELVARLRAASRRRSADDVATSVMVGATTINLAAKSAARVGEDGEIERVVLTPNEWRLLTVLLTNPGRLIPQATLLAELRGQQGYTNSSYVRIYIGQLRRKLEVEPSHPRHLITEPGMGYRFQP